MVILGGILKIALLAYVLYLFYGFVFDLFFGGKNK